MVHASVIVSDESRSRDLRKKTHGGGGSGISEEEPRADVSLVKSFSVGHGDMYYIRHNSDNFTIVDCCLPQDRAGSMLTELRQRSSDRGIHRIISTHPDQDHISGLVQLDDVMPIANFYVVKNDVTKSTITADFRRYRELHDSSKAYHISRGCSRRWMNVSDDVRGAAGVHILWPILGDLDHESASSDAHDGLPPNNISAIVQYRLERGASVLGIGDLETDFMEKLVEKTSMPKIDILFAPHYGRTSGKVPRQWLQQMDPGLIVIGEAPSEYLHYYSGYRIITQNSAGDVLFDCSAGKVDVYVEDHAYAADSLTDEGLDHEFGLYYVGTLYTHEPAD
jgi:beta-lactamase superfamily II metal-dependent hydrolase